MFCRNSPACVVFLCVRVLHRARLSFFSASTTRGFYNAPSSSFLFVTHAREKEPHHPSKDAVYIMLIHVGHASALATHPRRRNTHGRARGCVCLDDRTSKPSSKSPPSPCPSSFSLSLTLNSPFPSRSPCVSRMLPDTTPVFCLRVPSGELPYFFFTVVLFPAWTRVWWGWSRQWPHTTL